MLAAVLFLLTNFVFVAKAQMIAPPLWRLPNGSLSISDGPTFSYGTISVNGSSDKIFTLSTDRGRIFGMSGTTFSSGVYSYKGGTYPGTGGDCSTTLQPLTSCSVVVTATSNSAGTFGSNLAINYNTGSAFSTFMRALNTVFLDATAQLAWSNPLSYVKVNDCNQFTLQRQDSAGNPVSLASVTVGTLVVNNAVNTQFFSTSACTSARTIGTIESGSTGVALFLRSTTGNQSGILVATNGGVTSASHNVNVTTSPIRIE